MVKSKRPRELVTKTSVKVHKKQKMMARVLRKNQAEETFAWLKKKHDKKRGFSKGLAARWRLIAAAALSKRARAYLAVLRRKEAGEAGGNGEEAAGGEDAVYKDKPAPAPAGWEDDEPHKKKGEEE